MPEYKEATTPHFNVGCLNKQSGHKGIVGAAWRKDDGSTYVKLNNFVVIDTTEDEIFLTLFPIADGGKPVKRRKAQPDNNNEAAGDDIPF